LSHNRSRSFGSKSVTTSYPDFADSTAFGC
jgi:hypothetical protein